MCEMVHRMNIALFLYICVWSVLICPTLDNIQFDLLQLTLGFLETSGPLRMLVIVAHSLVVDCCGPAVLRRPIVWYFNLLLPIRLYSSSL